MTLVDKFIGIWSIGGCFWMLFYFIGSLAISGFITRRYKDETGLINTAFFSKHAIFIQYLPNFLAGGFFATHLMMCEWGWRIYGNRKMFRDIQCPEDVLQYFSRSEIRRVKIVTLSGFIVILYMFAFFVFKVIWPNQFG